MYCLCVNVYCHRVTTQLQLINISYITLNRYSSDNGHVILCLVRFIHFTEGTYMSLEVNLTGEVAVTRISKSDSVEVKRSYSFRNLWTAISLTRTKHLISDVLLACPPASVQPHGIC